MLTFKRFTGKTLETSQRVQIPQHCNRLEPLSSPTSETVPTDTMSTSARNRKPGAPSTDDDAAATVPRAPASTNEAKAELKAAVKQQAAKTSSGFSLLDVLRVLAGLALLSAGLSYLSTSGTSMTWGYNAKWTRMQEWKGLLVRFSKPVLNTIPLRFNED
jgi:hypothetical protein